MKQLKKKIPLSTPHFFGNESKSLKECVASGWVTTSGKFIDLFEKKIKKITCSKYAISLINCSSALQLAIRALNPNKGDEVIVPSITFIASINSVIYNNCSPVFMDVEDNFLIDINKVLKFLKEETFFKNGFSYNKKTQKKIIAIMVVHTFGNCVNLNKELIKVFKNHNIKIIEDAAESFGSYSYDKKKKYHSGTKGDIGCFSFNGNKIFTSGGGGMIATNNKSYAMKIFYLANQAKDDSIQFIHNEVGYNYRMSNLHAAFGNSQIDNLNKILKKKKIIHNIYLQHFNKISGLDLLKQTQNSYSNYWLNILKINRDKYGFSKNFVIKYLIKNGVEVRSVWMPNHLQKPFLNFQKYNISESFKLFSESICLPSSFSLTKKDQLYVIELLKKIF
jgi:perosamine synthetase